MDRSQSVVAGAPASLTSKAISWAGLYLRLVLVVITVHTPSWLLAWSFQGPRADERPIFNLDVLAAAALASVSPLAGGVVMVTAWASDAARLASKNFHFMSALDFMDAARFIDMLNVGTFLTPLASLIAVCIGLCGWLVIKQVASVRRLGLFLLAFTFACVALDAINGSFHGFGLEKDRRLINVNLAGSPSWNIWRAQRQNGMASTLPAPAEGAVTFNAIGSWHAAHPQASSLLVLVESMGLPKHPALIHWLHARIDTPRISQRWTIRSVQEHFSGSTTWGELRTLCGLQGHYTKLDEQSVQGCLPNRFAKQGIHSVGIHGFGLRMFDRARWWPRIGLKPWIWPDDPSASRLPMNCNLAFPGICDSALLQQAVAEAQAPARMAYALTLDTHLPLSSEASIPAELQRACVQAAAPPSACQLVRQVGLVLEDLEQRLAASSATPFVAITGDHAPPFGERANREVFESNQVPVFLLEPRPVNER